MDLGTTQNQQHTGGAIFLFTCSAWWLHASTARAHLCTPDDAWLLHQRACSSKPHAHWCLALRPYTLDTATRCGWRTFYDCCMSFCHRSKKTFCFLACDRAVVFYAFFTRMAKCDIWQFGVIIAIMFLCLLPTTVFMEAFIYFALQSESC